jgi:hypothetical protein
MEVMNMNLSENELQQLQELITRCDFWQLAHAQSVITEELTKFKFVRREDLTPQIIREG